MATHPITSCAFDFTVSFRIWWFFFDCQSVFALNINHNLVGFLTSGIWTWLFICSFHHIGSPGSVASSDDVVQ